MKKLVPVLPPTMRPTYSGQIEAMKTGTDLFFEGANPRSIASLCSMIGSRLERKYVTEAKSKGIQVWRVT